VVVRFQRGILGAMGSTCAAAGAARFFAASSGHRPAPDAPVLLVDTHGITERAKLRQELGGNGHFVFEELGEVVLEGHSGFPSTDERTHVPKLRGWQPARGSLEDQAQPALGVSLIQPLVPNLKTGAP